MPGARDNLVAARKNVFVVVVRCVVVLFVGVLFCIFCVHEWCVCGGGGGQGVNHSSHFVMNSVTSRGNVMSMIGWIYFD